MKSLIIFSIAVVISLIIIILTRAITKKDIFDTVLAPIFVFIGAICFVVGIIVLPLAKEDHVDHLLLQNYEIIYTESAIIVDLTNSNHPLYPNIFKLDSYKCLNEINKETKFVIEIKRSFYGVNLRESLVWTNPPYRSYNKSE